MKIRNYKCFAFSSWTGWNLRCFPHCLQPQAKKSFHTFQRGLTLTLSLGARWPCSRAGLAQSLWGYSVFELSAEWCRAELLWAGLQREGRALWARRGNANMLWLQPNSVENLLNLTVIWSIWKTLYRMDIIYSMCRVQCISPLFLPQNNNNNKYGCTSLCLCFHFCVHRRSPSPRWWPAAVASCATSVALAARTRKPCSTTWATCWRTAALGWVRAGLLSLLSTYVSFIVNVYRFDRRTEL